MLTQEIEDKIDIWLSIICKEHKINTPTICYKPHIWYGSCYDNAINELYIDTNSKDTIMNKIVSDTYNINLSSDMNIIIFTFLHELAHCLCYTKYPIWAREQHENFDKFYYSIEQKEKITLKNHQDYRKLKAERFADRIAVYFMRKYFLDLHLKKEAT